MNGFITVSIWDDGEVSLRTYNDKEELLERVNKDLDEYNHWEDEEDYKTLEQYFDENVIGGMNNMSTLYVVKDGENELVNSYEHLESLK